MKTPSDSEILTRHLVKANQVNNEGFLFGSVLLGWITEAAVMSAQKYCEGPVLTVSIDHLYFKTPMTAGNHVIIGAMVNYTGKTSMEVGVKIAKEILGIENWQHVTTAYITLVAILNGKPIPVSKLTCTTDEDKRRYSDALPRFKKRKKLEQEMKSQQVRPLQR